MVMKIMALTLALFILSIKSELNCDESNNPDSTANNEIGIPASNGKLSLANNALSIDRNV